MRSLVVCALLLGAGHAAVAADTRASADEATPKSRYQFERSGSGAGHAAIAAATRASAGEAAPPSRYKLERSLVEPAAQEGGRYRVRARIAPVESAGELREGDNFALIGRIAPKASMSCSATTLFRNGFE